MLLEREKELDLLARLIADLEIDGGKVVLLRGEAGIGKSSLIQEFLSRHSGESHVHIGYSDDLLTPQPFGPFWDMARGEPALSEALEEGNRLAVFDTLLNLLSPKLRPNIMVIEDTHWSDDATLDAIKYMGRRIRGTNGLLLLTYRDGEVDDDHPLRAVIGQLPADRVVRIQLAGLSRDAVAAIYGGPDLDRLVEITHGNPFLVTEMSMAGRDDVPTSIRDAVMARVGRLSPEAAEVLKRLSVVAEPVPPSDVEAFTGATAYQLAECERVGLLEIGSNLVSFRHELTRRAVEASLTISEAIAINGEYLEMLSPETDPAQLAHYARAANDVDRLLLVIPKAARAAAAVESHSEAASHFRSLRPHMERIPPEERALLLEEWARIEFYLGNEGALEIILKAIDLYQALALLRREARALILSAEINETNLNHKAALDDATRALAIVREEAPGPDLVHVLAGYAWLLLWLGRTSEAEEFSNEAVEMAEVIHDDESALYALSVKGTLAYVRGEGEEILDDVRIRAESGRLRYQEVYAVRLLAGVSIEIFELEQGLEFAQRALDAAVRFEIPTLEGDSQRCLAEILLHKGQWNEAEDVLETVVPSPKAEVLIEYIRGIIQLRQGHPEGAAHLERSWALAEDSGEVGIQLPVAGAVAEAMWLGGEEDGETIARLRDLMTQGFQREWLWPSGCLGHRLMLAGEAVDYPPQAPPIYRSLEEGDVGPAVSFFEERGAPYERALALWLGSAEDRLEALAILDGLGAYAVAAKLRGGLREEGVSVPRGKARATRDHVAGLTARQAEILQLLGEGLTNPEIADRLFVSPRTVENHVSAVLRRLGASSRSQAVEIARSEGLLTG